MLAKVQRQAFVVVVVMAMLVGFWGGQTYAANTLASQALAKLSAKETYALISPVVAVAQGYQESASSEEPGLDHVMKTYLELLERHKGPLKFLGNELGEEYDTYCEYLQAEWGGIC